MAILSREKRGKYHHPPLTEPSQWPKTANGYQLKCPIGYGTFAVVHKAMCKKEDGAEEEVAVKVIDLEDCSDSTFEELRREMSAMRLSRHDNVLQFHVAFQSDAKIWLVMPIAQEGSAADVMRCQPEKRFEDERIVAYILREVVKALDYLHGERQMHRDLKAGNVLIREDARVCLADFGVATPYSFENRHSTFVGTPCWMAPEVLAQHQQYDEKADVWSFGITAMELFRGEAPYQRLQPLKVMKNIIENEPPHLHSSECSGGLFLLVDFCLKKNPKERPSMNTCAKAKFFHKAERGVLQQLLLKTPKIENRKIHCPPPRNETTAIKISRNGDFAPMEKPYDLSSNMTEKTASVQEDWIFDDGDSLDGFDDFPEEET